MENKKEIARMQDMVFGILDQIYIVCEKSAKEFDSKSVPLSLLKYCIEETKKGLTRGIKKK